MRFGRLKNTALPAGGDLGANDGARISGRHADVDRCRPAGRVDWLMITSTVVLGVLMGFLAFRGWLPQALW